MGIYHGNKVYSIRFYNDYNFSTVDITTIELEKNGVPKDAKLYDPIVLQIAKDITGQNLTIQKVLKDTYTKIDNNGVELLYQEWVNPENVIEEPH
jgi:hypothetical protein